MKVERFLDTNVLLYGYDLDAPEKREVALDLIELGWSQPGSTALSVQVLQEFVVNFIKSGHSCEEAATVAGDFSTWPVVDITIPLFRLCLAVQARWQTSLWDAMIVAAAQASGARELLTEDLNHGQDYGGVKVINPFLKGPKSKG
ncbi:MAG: PIN domain-containing protein [Terrimicrobiaceae bacterium]